MAEDPKPVAVTMGDRRPIAARRLGVMHGLARWCVRAGITPNAISVLGMVAAIVAGVLIARSTGEGLAGRGMLVLAAALIQLRLLCNLIDGLVAVEGHCQTPTGELYNEVPDRVSDVAVLAGAGYAVGSLPVLGWSAAVAAVFVAYIRAVGKGAGLPSDFRGPMAKQQRMATITLACVLLAVLPSEWMPTITWAGDQTRFQVGIMGLALVVIVLGSVWTAVRRLLGIARGLRARGMKFEPPGR